MVTSEAEVMRHSQTKIVTFTLAVTLAMLLAGGAHAALTGGKTAETSSGGTSSSGSGTSSSSCIGTPTGGKYSSASYSGSSGCTTGVPGTDSDGDSMLDTWEMTYSLNKDSSLDRYVDGDSDNCTNACEHARGGVPNDDDSDNDGIKDMDDSDFTGIGATANGTYKGRKVTNINAAE